MRTITIDINNSIYDHIMFFLKSLPTNLINIHLEDKKNKIQSVSKSENLRGAFQAYADPQKQPLEDDAWKNHVLEKYNK